MTPEALRDLPPEVEQRVREWRGLWRRAAFYHWALGLGGIVVSALAAAKPTSEYSIFGILAAICFALMTFANPRAAYQKFVRAWRTLDLACLRYRVGQLDLPDLVAAVERGEAIITEHEDRESRPVLPRAT